MKKKYYWVYILRVKGGMLYTGYTSDLEKRYYEHHAGTTKCKFTRSFPPEKIAACWRVYESIGSTLKIEHYIKRLHRNKKTELIKTPSLLKQMLKSDAHLVFNIRKYDPGHIEKKVRTRLQIKKEELRLYLVCT